MPPLILFADIVNAHGVVRLDVPDVLHIVYDSLSSLQSFNIFDVMTFGEGKAAAAFTDVPADAYYAKAVAWAVEQGITLGTSSTTFSPDDPCTRGQAAAFMYRLAQLAK